MFSDRLLDEDERTKACTRVLVVGAREHMPLLVFLLIVALTYTLLRTLIAAGPRVDLPLSTVLVGLFLLFTTLVGVGCAFAATRLLRRLRGKAPVAWSEYIVTTEHVVGLAVVTLWWPVYVQLFDAIKAYIPLIQPFYLDPLFAQADQLLHAGQHPFHLLHGLFGGENITLLIDRVYESWYTVGLIFLLWQALDWNRKLRFRFLLCFALIWFLLGNVLATAASSAGPVYYERLYSEDIYSGLLKHLESVHQSHSLFMWNLQESLWTNYMNHINEGQYTVGAISAMPSVHVAIAALLGFRAQASHWILGLLAWGYAFLILIGSVYLGWHYAIDGYVSIALTGLLWWWSASFTDWYWENVMDRKLIG